MPIYQSIYSGPPNGYTAAYTKKKYIAIHNTSNSATAEAEASYATWRPDRTSSHYYVDSNSIVQSLTTDFQAWHAGSVQGNMYGIAYEITGVNSWSRQQWLDNVAWDILANQIATDMRYWGIQNKHLSVQEMQAGNVTGIVTHNDMRLAWGGTDHTDPGPNFPMDYLIQKIQSKLSPTYSQEEDDMRHTQGQIAQGNSVTMVSTPWTASTISLGCDFGKAKLRVAEHLVGTDQWFITEIVVTSNDTARKDLPKRTNVDRRSIMRLPLDENDKLDTPVGYFAWWD